MNSLNTLFILSDEHRRDASGCYGHPLVKTPNIDNLASEGTLFESAYTNSPICIPARAALQTGRYVHRTRNWCNGNSYCGQIEGWGHHLKSAGHEVVSIGKLHFRSSDDDNGFTEEILPLHVVDGVGDLLSCLRKVRPPRHCEHLMSENIGPGETDYQRYDRSIANAACEWIRKKADAASGKPWTLFFSFVCPHFPLIAPEEFYQMYDPDEVELPKRYGDDGGYRNPAMKGLHEYQNFDEYFDERSTRIAIASYYGLVSFVDSLIGQVREALEEAGLADSTRIIYTSDHGDNLGDNGFWGKSTLYEESAGVPLVMAGPDIPVGKRVSTPATLVDLAPTFLEFNGESLTEEEKNELPGTNLLDLANGADPARVAFSEYHAIGSITGAFMIRYRNWKYIYHVDYSCQLFDLEADPQELNDLGEDPSYEETRTMLHSKLLEICDPEEVNRQAFADQAARVEANGGVDAVLQRSSIPYTPAPVE